MVLECIHKVIKVSKKQGVATGIHVMNIDAVKGWMDEGMRLILYLSDINMIINSAMETIKELNKLR